MPQVGYRAQLSSGPGADADVMVRSVWMVLLTVAAVVVAVQPAQAQEPADSTTTTAAPQQLLSDTQRRLGNLAVELDAALLDVRAAQTGQEDASAALAGARAEQEAAEATVDRETDKARRQAAATYVATPSSDVADVLADNPTRTIAMSVGITKIAERQAGNLASANESLETAQVAVRGAEEVVAARAADLEAAQVALRVVQSNISSAQADWTAAVGLAGTTQVTIGADGCPTSAPTGTLWNGADVLGIHELCVRSVAAARTPQAALAIKFALAQLGAPYSQPMRMRPAFFDCSSLVMRSYEAAGVPTVSVGGGGWAPTTFSMLAAPWALAIPYEMAQPGDLIFPDAGHVAMLLADGWMVHTSRPSLPARVERAYEMPGMVRAIDVGQLPTIGPVPPDPAPPAAAEPPADVEPVPPIPPPTAEA